MLSCATLCYVLWAHKDHQVLPIPLGIHNSKAETVPEISLTGTKVCDLVVEGKICCAGVTLS